MAYVMWAKEKNKSRNTLKIKSISAEKILKKKCLSLQNRLRTILTAYTRAYRHLVERSCL